MTHTKTTIMDKLLDYMVLITHQLIWTSAEILLIKLTPVKKCRCPKTKETENIINFHMSET